MTCHYVLHTVLGVVMLIWTLCWFTVGLATPPYIVFQILYDGVQPLEVSPQDTQCLRWATILGIVIGAYTMRLSFYLYQRLEQLLWNALDD